MSSLLVPQQRTQETFWPCRPVRLLMGITVIPKWAFSLNQPVLLRMKKKDLDESTRGKNYNIGSGYEDNLDLERRLMAYPIYVCNGRIRWTVRHEFCAIACRMPKREMINVILACVSELYTLNHRWHWQRCAGYSMEYITNFRVHCLSQ